jgi:alpha-glucan phosphorylases
MMPKKYSRPDYLFEVSWEVCNKVGGIHTVIATKALNMSKEYGKSHVLIGPDVWMETEENPEFTEDNVLYKSWVKEVLKEGIRVRVGKWNVAGNPTVILVDYTSFISKKDEIFADLWTKFGLDSISGQWDYIESALFGYATGKVIESFVQFNLQPYQKVVAQFHEWMTGAGILYLKSKNLSIGTVFTTHATVVGRCLACNNVPLYDSLSVYDGDEKARQFNVTAKHSLEKTASHEADVFTTVSDITAKECLQFLKREVDFITPNGFENTFTPKESDYDKFRSEAREKLLNVASLMHNVEYPKDTVIIGISGRYEYKNKGIDVFLDALERIKSDNYSGRKILAFLMIPAGNNGPDKDLLNKINGTGNNDYTTKTTHYLAEPEYDVIIKKINQIYSEASSNDINIAYVPTYLNGNDGIFNATYYNLLVGMDLTIFPSYYEPWGYTPLESIAFKVPTLTTSVAGFGLWVERHYKGEHPSISIVERNDSNYDMVVDGVIARIGEIIKLDKEKRAIYSENAIDVSKISLWSNNIQYYEKAYLKALDNVIQRKGAFPEYRGEQGQTFNKFRINSPTWRNLLVNKKLPERLKHLDTISKNLWWCWNQEAIDLFKSIDMQLWNLSNGNPVAMLDMISLKSYKELAQSEEFTARLDEVYEIFKSYMAEKPKAASPSISYFCMEYGLDTSLKIYSGGLGILAGDYLKEASDMNIKMTAVGLLYKYGYFTQQLSAQGDQVAIYDPQDFSKTPAQPLLDKDNNWLMVSIALPGRNLYAKIWKVEVGRVDLYLLDTDIDQNSPEDRNITYQLYGGDLENRLKQELLLGMGGIKALRLLGIHSDVYHCNEGHAAFTGLERMHEYIQNDNLSSQEALEVVRASSLFTTHTPVPAGHDAFPEDMLRKYISHCTSKLKMDWVSVMALGKIDPYNPNEKFSMSNLAANLSQEVNGVSWLHGKVSRDIFAGLWPGYLPEELHIGYVTNGVHYPTWAAPEWKSAHARVFGSEFASHHYDKKCFEGIKKLSDEEIWSIRTQLKSKLIKKVKDCLSDSNAVNYYAPHHIVQIKNTLRDDVLTIGFARRFATYKRAHLLFRNLDRLDKIVNNPERPVQLLYAGKAHPADKAGQDLIKRVVEVSKMPQFIGKIVFVPNYDITLAKFMVQGVDIWMNTPTRPLEASGTSGEKAVMNGVMHFSVMDGWWVEGYKENAGWALQMERTYENQDFQDELDAVTIYNMIESEIAPIFYDKNIKGISPIWINIIKNCISDVASNFTTNRMMEDYINKYYNPLAKRKKMLVDDDYREAKEIAFWKRKMRRDWSSIIVENNSLSSLSGSLLLGNEYDAEVTLEIGDIDPNYLGIEALLAQQNAKGRYIIKEVFDFKLKDYKEGKATYLCKIIPDKTGLYQISGRLFAKNKLLPHRQDFELVKWL